MSDCENVKASIPISSYLSTNVRLHVVLLVMSGFFSPQNVVDESVCACFAIFTKHMFVCE